MQATIHLREWFQLHRPHWHETAERAGHLVHDVRFWTTLAVIALFAILLAIGILAGRGTMVPSPYVPYVPYMH